MLDIINIAKKVSGKDIPYTITDRREGDPENLMASCDLAFDLLGWKAEDSDLETIFTSMSKVYL